MHPISIFPSSSYVSCSVFSSFVVTINNNNCLTCCSCIECRYIQPDLDVVRMYVCGVRQMNGIILLILMAYLFNVLRRRVCCRWSAQTNRNVWDNDKHLHMSLYLLQHPLDGCSRRLISSHLVTRLRFSFLFIVLSPFVGRSNEDMNWYTFSIRTLVSGKHTKW